MLQGIIKLAWYNWWVPLTDETDSINLNGGGGGGNSEQISGLCWIEHKSVELHVIHMAVIYLCRLLYLACR